MKTLKTVFMGTPDFAVPCLLKLAEISDVVGVVTQPDRPRGRGQKETPSPVKSCAVSGGFSVYQPKKIRSEDFFPVLEALSPDIIVVVAFGQILPKRILDLPRLGCVNVHASLLPKYRGAAPMQRCLMAGDKVTGVTTMFMDEGLDTGDMLLRKEVTISSEMNFGELHDELSGVGAELLSETVTGLRDGTVSRTKQKDDEASYADKISKSTGKIDWTKNASEIHNLVRALSPFPGAYTFLEGKTYKIWRAKVVEDDLSAKPGEIMRGDAGELLVGTGKGALSILEIQAPGRKRMSAAEYLRGNGISSHAFFRDTEYL